MSSNTEHDPANRPSPEQSEAQKLREMMGHRHSFLLQALTSHLYNYEENLHNKLIAIQLLEVNFTEEHFINIRSRIGTYLAAFITGMITDTEFMDSFEEVSDSVIHDIAEIWDGMRNEAQENYLAYSRRVSQVGGDASVFDGKTATTPTNQQESQFDYLHKRNSYFFGKLMAALKHNNMTSYQYFYELHKTQPRTEDDFEIPEKSWIGSVLLAICTGHDQYIQDVIQGRDQNFVKKIDEVREIWDDISANADQLFHSNWTAGTLSETTPSDGLGAERRIFQLLNTCTQEDLEQVMYFYGELVDYAKLSDNFQLSEITQFNEQISTLLLFLMIYSNENIGTEEIAQFIGLGRELVVRIAEWYRNEMLIESRSEQYALALARTVMGAEYLHPSETDTLVTAFISDILES